MSTSQACTRASIVISFCRSKIQPHTSSRFCSIWEKTTAERARRKTRPTMALPTTAITDRAQEWARVPQSTSAPPSSNGSAPSPTPRTHRRRHPEIRPRKSQALHHSTDPCGRPRARVRHGSAHPDHHRRSSRRVRLASASTTCPSTPNVRSRTPDVRQLPSSLKAVHQHVLGRCCGARPNRNDTPSAVAQCTSNGAPCSVEHQSAAGTEACVGDAVGGEAPQCRG